MNEGGIKEKILTGELPEITGGATLVFSDSVRS